MAFEPTTEPDPTPTAGADPRPPPPAGPPAAFYPDPHGRHEVRWWDGTAWTTFAGSGGRIVLDDADPRSRHVRLLSFPVLQYIERQPGRVGGPVDILAPDGAPAGYVRSERATHFAGIVSTAVQTAVVDHSGLLVLTHVADGGMSDTSTVRDPNGDVIGQFIRPNMFSQTSDIVTGHGLVGHLPTGGRRATVTDPNRVPLASLDCVEDGVNWFNNVPYRQEWSLRILHSYPWAVHLMLLAAPIEASVRLDRRRVAQRSNAGSAF